MKHIYLDNAATTPVDPQVLEAMLPYLQANYGNPSSIHAAGRKARAAVEQARKTIAQHLQASVGEIFFTSGGSESNNMAIKGAVQHLGVKHIISSSIEHHCVLHTVAALAKSGQVKLHLVPLMANGHVNLQALETLLNNLQAEPKMVCLMHCNNEIGNLLDFPQVSALCQAYNAFFHTDTVQSIGFHPIDVQAHPVHFLSGSAHKLYGPKGVGFIYINADNSIPPMILGGSQERNMRAGTENVCGIVGLGKAVDIAYTDIAKNKEHISTLKNYLANKLIEYIPQIQFHGDYPNQSTYKILNVGFPPSLQAELLLLNLDISGICASGGSACSSGVDVGSHVLEALQIDPDLTNIRFSFSKFNTIAELDVVIDKLLDILKIKQLKSIVE